MHQGDIWTGLLYLMGGDLHRLMLPKIGNT